MFNANFSDARESSSSLKTSLIAIKTRPKDLPKATIDRLMHECHDFIPNRKELYWAILAAAINPDLHY